MPSDSAASKSEGTLSPSAARRNGSLFEIGEHGEEGEPRVITVRGELDAAVCSQLVDALSRALNGGHTGVILDLDKTTFIDSSGVRAIVFAHRDADDRPRSSFVLACARDQVRRVLELTGLSERLPIYPNRDEALAALSSTA